MPNDTGVVLSTLEVCNRLRVGRSTVERLVHSGALPATKLPGRTGAYVFRDEDVEALRTARAGRGEHDEAAAS